MRMEASLQYRMEQRLKLAPQIIQSIEILQLNAIGLENYVKQEMLENPTLELGDRREEEGTQTPAEPATEPGREPAKEDDFQRKDGEFERLDAEFERIERQDDGWHEFGRFRGSGGGEMESDRKLEAMQNTAARGASLQDYLFGQFALLDGLFDELRDAAEAIVYNIDENGYLAYSLEEIYAGMEEPLPPFERMEEALRLVQSLDPPGIGARDLKECLLIQIGDNPHYKFERMLVEKHFEDIEKNRLPKIVKETGESMELIKEALTFLKALNPKPGSSFNSAQANYIVPDVVVDNVDGHYEVQLKNDFLPRIHISPRYRRMLHESKDDKAVRDYIKKKIEAAKWLIDSIQQRQNTLLKISQELVEYQRPFLDQGIDKLRPLKMQFIADRVGVHVSTVSRAINGKYIQTPRGIFAMKFFFTGGTTTSEGEEESILAVKQKVRDIVEAESKDNPLSDKDICDKLHEMGLDIARRTVTKYRKQMAIASSRQRREY